MIVEFQSPQRCLWFLLHCPGPRPAGPPAGFWSIYCLRSKRTGLGDQPPDQLTLPLHSGAATEPGFLMLRFQHFIHFPARVLWAQVWNPQQLPSLITPQHSRESQGWGPEKGKDRSQERSQRREQTGFQSASLGGLRG